MPFLCSIAYKLRIVDTPDGKIKNHDKVTPYLGGIGVYCGFLSGIALTMPSDSYIPQLLIGCTLLLLLGLIDDLIPLKAYQKFFGQSIIALSFLRSGFYLKEHFFYNTWNIILSFLWILTIINAFNLIDVMDGLATTVALGAAATFFMIAWFLCDESILIALSAFIGSLVAFLWYNKPSAQIYLGDSGSLFIGGFLGTIPFLFNWGTFNSYAFLSPIIILAIPLLECFFLIVIRWRKGIPFYNASPDHFSIYLQKKGWSREQILLYIFTLFSVSGSVAFLFSLGFLSFTAIALLGLLFLISWVNILFFS